MTAIRKIYSSFSLSHLHPGWNKNEKNENPENDKNTSYTGVNQKENTEEISKDPEKTENYIFLLPPVILLLAILIMYILNKIFS